MCWNWGPSQSAPARSFVRFLLSSPGIPNRRATKASGASMFQKADWDPDTLCPLDYGSVRRGLSLGGAFATGRRGVEFELDKHRATTHQNHCHGHDGAPNLPHRNGTIGCGGCGLGHSSFLGCSFPDAEFKRRCHSNPMRLRDESGVTDNSLCRSRCSSSFEQRVAVAAVREEPAYCNGI